MRRVGENVFAEIYFPGCNPDLVVTGEGVVMIGAPQTGVYLPEEGVLFTGDNVFHRVKTWIQEADPWQWLATLKRIDELNPVDPFPIAQRLFPRLAQVNQMIVSNLYRRIVDREQGGVEA